MWILLTIIQECFNLQETHFNRNLTKLSGNTMNINYRLGKVETRVFPSSMQPCDNWTPQDLCTIDAEWLWLLSLPGISSWTGMRGKGTLPPNWSTTVLCKTQEAGSGQWEMEQMLNPTSESSTLGVSRPTMILSAFISRNGCQNCDLLMKKWFTHGVLSTVST